MFLLNVAIFNNEVRGGVAREGGQYPLADSVRGRQPAGLGRAEWRWIFPKEIEKIIFDDEVKTQTPILIYLRYLFLRHYHYSHTPLLVLHSFTVYLSVPVARIASSHITYTGRGYKLIRYIENISFHSSYITTAFYPPTLPWQIIVL